MMDQSPLLSPTARAILAGMRQDPNYAQQAQQGGLADLDEALRLKAIADKVSQSGQMQGPAPGNVVDDLKMKVQMALSGQSVAPPMPQGAPQGAMPPQGMPPQGAMPPQQPQMDPRMAAGIGTLPAPNMTQGMAAGGIVAFARGGDEGLGNKYGRPYGSPPDVVGPYLDEYGPLLSQEEADAEVAKESAGEGAGAGAGGGGSGYGILDAYMRGAVPPEVDRGAIQSDVNKAYSPLERMLAGRAAELQRREQAAEGLSEADLKALEKENRFERAAGIADALTKGARNDLELLGYALSGYARAKAGGTKEERALKRELAKEKERLADANYAVRETGARLNIDKDAETQKRHENAVERREISLYRKAGLELDLQEVQARQAMYGARTAAAGKTPGSLYIPKLADLEVALEQAKTPEEAAAIQQQIAIVNARYSDAAAAGQGQGAKTENLIKTETKKTWDTVLKTPGSAAYNANMIIASIQRKDPAELTEKDRIKYERARRTLDNELEKIKQSTRRIYGPADVEEMIGAGGEFEGFSIVSEAE